MYSNDDSQARPALWIPGLGQPEGPVSPETNEVGGWFQQVSPPSVAHRIQEWAPSRIRLLSWVDVEGGADLVSADGHFEHVEGTVWVRVATA